MAEELAQVLSELDDRERKLTLLEELIMERHLGDPEQTALSGWPIRSGYITSTFGFRKDPYRGRGAFHKGVDSPGARGSPVIAVAEGVVTFSGKQSGYGNLVEIRHKDGLVTRYGHCQKLLVREGALIESRPDHCDPGLHRALHGAPRPLRSPGGRQAGQPPHVHRPDQSRRRYPLSPEPLGRLTATFCASGCRKGLCRPLRRPGPSSHSPLSNAT